MSTKPAHVREMFGSIATRYDLANHVLSCGIDFYWRARAAEIVDAWHPHTIADLATGTGDLALATAKEIAACGTDRCRFPAGNAGACAAQRCAAGGIG